MPLIRRRREPLPLKDMAQMPAAVGAHNLCPHGEQGAVLMALDGAGDAVKVGGPAAAAAEFVRGFVEGRFAAGTGVHALGGVVLVEFTGAGSFGTLFAQDAELLCDDISWVFSVASREESSRYPCSARRAIHCRCACPDMKSSCWRRRLWC